MVSTQYAAVRPIGERLGR